MISDNQGLIAEQAGRLHLEIPLLGIYSDIDTTVEQVDQQFVKGIVFPKFSEADSAFIRHFYQKYGENPKDPAEYAYDFVMLLNLIVNTYGTQPEDVKRGFHSIQEYHGASGSISIDKDGNRVGKASELWEIGADWRFVRIAGQSNSK